MGSRKKHNKIAAVQPAAITKKKHYKKEYLLRRSSQRRYNLHIVAVFYTTVIVSVQNDIFIVAGFWSAAISKLTPLKHIYCVGFMSRHCRTSQKTRATAVVPKNTAICDI